MAIHLHRAARTDLLADGLAGVLATPPDDPFALDVVAVPAKGVERWLSQRLSHRLGVGAGTPGHRPEDGVCAAVDFRTPASLVAEIAGTRDNDPWSPDALAWPVLAGIDAGLDEPWALTLARHLGHEPDPVADPDGLRRGRRFAVARRLAGLFASYAAQRPALLAAWEAGDDSDGLGAALPDDLRWQAELWRRVTAAVQAPTPGQRHTEVLAALRSRPATVELPARLSLFGHTRLSTTDVELLDALAEHRDVHLWLPHPSDRLWQTLAAAGADRPLARRLDDSHLHVGHRLLASLGRDVRELQRTLHGLTPATDEVVAAPTPAPDTLLHWLQHDLHEARRPTPAERGQRVLDPADRSVQVHACHGPARQVEVLREVLLGLLADDPTLEPRDILVMCPDIDTFAPLVQAGFGLGEVVGDRGHPAHRLRVRLADRALHQTNPLLAVLDTLLDLAGGRVTASEVLDLAQAGPVRRRFRFGDDDLDQLTSWVQESGVRWGFDAQHRRPFGLETLVQNTWRFGVDRILAGVAMSDDSRSWLDTTLPLDDVGSSQLELAGQVAELLDRLVIAADRLTGPQTLDAWVQALGDALASITAVAPADAWQVGQAERELARLRQAAEPSGLASTSLRLSDIRALLSGRLAGRPTRANFRTGTLTVCTMVPMRSVPHRVVALLGLDDGVFPRVGVADGDDVLARDPVTGERDPRSEDRQLFLDAVLAAGEALVVTYTGADPHTGQPRPPAVPLGELLDALDETAVGPGSGAGTAATGAAQVPPVPVGEIVTTRHPLQPFDPRNFTSRAAGGGLLEGGPFSFDRDALASAAAATGVRDAPPPFLAEPLPAPAVGDVALDDLLAFVKHPVRHLLARGRLDIALPFDPDPVSDAVPVKLDALVQWGVAERVLADLLAGIEPGAAMQREWRRGVVPPRRLGWRALGTIVDEVRALADTARALRTGDPSAVDVDLDLGDGRRLRGTVPGLYAGRLVPVSYSRLAGSHRLASWVRLLALTAHHPDGAWQAHTIGRRASGSGVDVSVIGPLDDSARGHLRDLVALRDLGVCEPLPLPVKASFSYANQRLHGRDVSAAIAQAHRAWDDTDAFPGEGSDSALLRVWGRGGLPGLDRPPPPGFEFPGETTMFGALAMRLWHPLLTAEAQAERTLR